MDKNQYERYKKIDRLLRGTPNGLPLDVLLERLNSSMSEENQIKRRQLQYDLEALKESAQKMLKKCSWSVCAAAIEKRAAQYRQQIGKKE